MVVVVVVVVQCIAIALHIQAVHGLAVAQLFGDWHSFGSIQWSLCLSVYMLRTYKIEVHGFGFKVYLGAYLVAVFAMLNNYSKVCG